MKLLIVNGPWGVGKSTAARSLHARMPGSFHVEIDVIRRSISHYEAALEESFRFSVRIASDIIERCLAEGRDVIVDKMLFDPQIIDDIRSAGDRHGAEVFEIILWADKATVLTRGEQRGYSKGTFSKAKAEESWDKISRILDLRKHAIVIPTDNLDEEGVVKSIEDVIGYRHRVELIAPPDLPLTPP